MLDEALRDDLGLGWRQRMAFQDFVEARPSDDALALTERSAGGTCGRAQQSPILSIGVEKGPPIGMEKGPLLIIGSGSSPKRREILEVRILRARSQPLDRSNNDMISLIDILATLDEWVRSHAGPKA